MLRFLLPMLSLVAAGLVAAQTPLDRNDPPGRAGPAVHVQEFGRYTVQANAVGSEVLAEGAAAQHGIERAADRGVLNVVVLERQGERRVTVPARVTAVKDNLLGQTEPIDMREIRQNGRVSYLGTFGFAPLRNFRFTLTVQPEGRSEPLTLEFEDRFAPRDG